MDSLSPMGEKMLELATLKEDYLVLDVATGTGEPGLSAAKRVRKGKVVGVDLSEEMLRIAEEKTRTLGIKNYETRVQDSSALSFDTNYFDAVICRLGMMFFPDMLTGLKEMVRVLKPARRLVVSVWGPQDERRKKIDEMLFRILQLPEPAQDAPGPYRCSKRGMITSLLNNSGLHDVKEIELPGHLTWDSPEKYWELQTDASPRMVSALNKMNEQIRKKAKDEVIEALKSIRGRKREISFNWIAWIDYGTKPIP